MSVTYTDDRVRPYGEPIMPRPVETHTEEPFVPRYARTGKTTRGGKGKVKTWMILAPIGVVVLGGAALALSMTPREENALSPSLNEPAATAPVLPAAPARVAAAPVAAVEATPAAAPAPVTREAAPVRAARAAPAPARRVAAPAPRPAAAARVQTPTVAPQAASPSTSSLNTAPTTPAPTTTPAPAQPPAPVIIVQPLG